MTHPLSTPRVLTQTFIPLGRVITIVSEETHYLKADLEDYADVESITLNEDGRVRHGRTSLLENALDAEVHTTCSGGYQGTYTFVLVAGGLLWVIKDSYGSCGLCDGLLHAKNYEGRDSPQDALEAVRNYAESMMRNAYAFDNKNDAVRFVHEAAAGDLDVSGWAWSDVDDGTIEAISEVDYE